MKTLFFSVTLCLLCICGFANAQDGDGLGSVIGPKPMFATKVDIDEVMPHFKEKSPRNCWVISVDTPTVSDCDIIIIKTKTNGVAKDIVAQVRCTKGQSIKEKAKSIAKELNAASDLNSDPIDAIASNGQVMVTANTGSSIEDIDFSNDTKEANNQIEEYKEKSTDKMAFHRYSDDITGNGMAYIEYNDTVNITVPTCQGDSLYQILYCAKTYLKAMGVDCWIGIDASGGYWLAHNMDNYVTKIGQTVNSVSFGCTDKTMGQRVITHDNIPLCVGVAVDIAEFNVLIME
jgi:hypothetical protein